MTRPITRPPSSSPPAAKHPVDLLLRALQSAVPTALLDLMLDRIEGTR
jgi:hypothetical protein